VANLNAVRRPNLASNQEKKKVEKKENLVPEHKRRTSNAKRAPVRLVAKKKRSQKSIEKRAKTTDAGTADLKKDSEG